MSFQQHGVNKATSSVLAASAGLREALPDFGGVRCPVCRRLGEVRLPRRAEKIYHACFLGNVLTGASATFVRLMTVSRERMNPLSLATCSPPVHFDRFMDLERCLAAGLSLDAALQIQACLKKDSLHDGTNYSGSVPLPGGAASTTVEAKRRRSTRAQNWLRSLPAALALFDRRTLSTEEATGAPRFFPGQYVVYHAGCVVEWFLLGSACTTE